MTVTLATVTPHTVAPADSTRWVEAAPFRAHLRHLCDVSGLPWPVLAMCAGVSVSLADHLLHGRRGRPVRRITHASAAQLLRITPADALALDRRWVDADESRRLVACLQKLGWSPERTAAASGLDVLVVRALLEGTTPTVARLTQLRLAAVLASLDLSAAGRSAA